MLMGGYPNSSMFHNPCFPFSAILVHLAAVDVDVVMPDQGGLRREPLVTMRAREGGVLSVCGSRNVSACGDQGQGQGSGCAQQCSLADGHRSGGGVR